MRTYLLSLIILFLPFCALASEGLISPPDAWTEAQTGDLLIVDVRTPPEYHWTGSPKTSERADWWQLSGRKGFLADVLKLTDGDRTRAIALICARGVRSSEATAFLTSQGFTNVRDIGEGMLGSAAGPGWLERKLPLR